MLVPQEMTPAVAKGDDPRQGWTPSFPHRVIDPSAAGGGRRDMEPLPDRRVRPRHRNAMPMLRARIREVPGVRKPT